MPAQSGSGRFTRRKFLTTNALIIAGAAGASSGIGASIFGPASAASADPSHQLPASGVRWSPGRLLPTFAEPGHLHAASVATLTGEDQLLLVTLQGIVNRTKPELYFVFDPGDNPVDQRWLDDYGKGRSTWHDDALSLVPRYRSRVRGAIVYDPDVPDSINVATTMAGLEDAVVATADQASTYGLKIIKDLRGQFTGQDKVAIYQWQLDHLWPRCDHRLLTGLTPTQVVDVPGVTWTEIARETEQIRDSSNRATLTWDLSQELGGEGRLPSLRRFLHQRRLGCLRRTSDGHRRRHGDRRLHSRYGCGDAVPVLGQLLDRRRPEQVRRRRQLLHLRVSSRRPAPRSSLSRSTSGTSIWSRRPTPRRPGWSRTRTSATMWSPTGRWWFWLDPNGDPGTLMGEIFDKSAVKATPYLGWFSNDVAGEWGGSTSPPSIAARCSRPTST